MFLEDLLNDEQYGMKENSFLFWSRDSLESPMIDGTRCQSGTYIDQHVSNFNTRHAYTEIRPQIFDKHGGYPITF